MTDALRGFIERSSRLLVLTGAGCSTDSGIPDYRDADGEWKRGRPIMLQDFLTDAHWRRRYWARSLVGWRRMRDAEPNDAHRALAALEHAGRVTALVTQNVDGLHQSAGSRNVIDLHGRLDEVRCIGCERRIPREHMQAELTQRNPAFVDLAAFAAPDGDAELARVDFARFEVPDCESCGGLLKPDVVFFGERVPPVRVQRAFAAVEESDAMLVVGSSLMVYSGYRFARAMADAGKPVAAVNLGKTRADDVLTVKVEQRCADALAFLLTERPQAPAAVPRRPLDSLAQARSSSPPAPR
jgi:NAD-dependent SIR2 family protein deacetylase